jgi:hypothetical protein
VIPVIGFLSSRSSDESASVVAAFRQGMNEAGYVEGQNVAIDFRWAEGQAVTALRWRPNLSVFTSGCCLCDARFIAALLCQHGPGNPRQLVGESRGQNVRM